MDKGIAKNISFLLSQSERMQKKAEKLLEGSEESVALAETLQSEFRESEED